jgi:hypothetical protein
MRNRIYDACARKECMVAMVSFFCGGCAGELSRTSRTTVVLRFRGEYANKGIDMCSLFGTG